MDTAPTVLQLSAFLSARSTFRVSSVNSTLMTAPVSRKAKFCFSCGDVIESHALVCPRCGTAQPTASTPSASEKRILPAFLLCFLLGVFGAHRFYVGKIGTGLLQLFTLGGCGIWWLVDMILLVSGEFRDKEGNRMTEWT